MTRTITQRTKRALGLLALAVSSTACGAGSVGEAVRPKDPTFNDATGGEKQKATVCRDVNAEGSPLVVDWKPEDRADLEVAMHAGVAIVHYDCDGVKLLPDCRFDGTYRFVGITRKEEVLSLADADEAKANLPFSGGKIGASMARGSSLDIALVMVGKTTASSLKVEKAALSGRCDGATHFLRAATLGAFAMKTRTSGKVGAAAELFGAGVSGDSASSKGVDTKEGDIGACQQSDSDSAKPPKSCGAPLRVQLLALDHQVSESSPLKEVTCPKGMVAFGDKCVAPAAEVPHECEMENVDDCLKQCDLGNTDSCTNLTLQALLKSLDDHPDPKWEKLVTHGTVKGCELGELNACDSLGTDYEKGQWGMKKDLKKAAELHSRACKGGVGSGCRNLGSMIPPDSRTLILFQRGCDSGDSPSCTLAGNQLDKGQGVPADPAGARSAFKRGCRLGDKKACAKAK